MSRIDPSARTAPAWAWIGLALALLLATWLRGHTFGPDVHRLTGFAPWPVSAGETEPLDCDEAVYLYCARRQLDGDAMYRDLTDTKPPGGYWLYAMAARVGGPTELTVRILPVPLVIVAVALVWSIGRRLGGPVAAVAAALAYAIASTDPSLFGNGANFEHAINAASLAALAILIGAWSTARRWPLAAAGACVGLAALVKQPAAAPIAVFAAALMMRGGRAWKAKIADVSTLVAGFAIAIGIAAAVLAAQGALPAAIDDVIRYGGALATDTRPDPTAPSPAVRWLTGNADPAGALPPPFGTTDYLTWWATGTWPLWLASAPSLLWLAIGRADARRRLVAAWTLAAWAQVVAPGLYWPHYYLLPLPGAAIAVAVAMADALRAARSDRRPIRGAAGLVVGLALGASIAAIGGLLVRDYLLLRPTELTIRHKGGRQWVVLRALGRDLARRTRGWSGPRPSLFVWGWQSPLYVDSGLDGASRQVFVDNLMRDRAGTDHPIVGPRFDRILAELRERPPAIVYAGYPPPPALLDFLRRGYEPSRLTPSAPDGRGLWVERGRYEAFEAAGPSTTRR